MANRSGEKGMSARPVYKPVPPLRSTPRTKYKYNRSVEEISRRGSHDMIRPRSRVTRVAVPQRALPVRRCRSLRSLGRGVRTGERGRSSAVVRFPGACGSLEGLPLKRNTVATAVARPIRALGWTLPAWYAIQTHVRAVCVVTTIRMARGASVVVARARRWVNARMIIV